MKKIIGIIILMSIFLSSLCLACYAATESDPYDSLRVPTEEAERFRHHPSLVVIKAYRGDFMYRFYENQNIDEILSRCFEISKCYFNVLKDGDNAFVRSDTGNGITSVDTEVDWSKVNVYKNVLFPQSVFEKASMNVKVKNVYFFYTQTTDYCFYIYYKTDRGDYIYYKPNTWEEKEYLFTTDEFFNFSKDYYEKLRSQSADELITTEQSAPHEMFDLSEYTLDAIHKKNMNRNILIICIAAVAIALVAGGVLITVHSKKKKAQI